MSPYLGQDFLRGFDFNASLSELLDSPLPYGTPGSAILFERNPRLPYRPNPMFRRGHGRVVTDVAGIRTYRVRPRSTSFRVPTPNRTPPSARLYAPPRERVVVNLLNDDDSDDDSDDDVDDVFDDFEDEGLGGEYSSPHSGGWAREDVYGGGYGGGVYGGMDQMDLRVLHNAGGLRGRRASCGANAPKPPRVQKRNISFSNAKQHRNRGGEVVGRRSNKGDRARRGSNKGNKERRSRNNNNEYNKERMSSYKVDKEMENRRFDGVKVYRNNRSNNKSNKENRSNNRSNKENRSNNRSNKEKQRNKLMQMSDRSLKRIYQELRKNQKLQFTGGRGGRRKNGRRNEDGWIEDERMERWMSKNNSNYTRKR